MKVDCETKGTSQMKKLKYHAINFILILISSIYIARIFYKEISLVPMLNSIFIISLGLFTLGLMSIVLKSGFFDQFLISFRKIVLQEYKIEVIKDKRQSIITKSIITSAGTMAFLTLIISFLFR